MLKKKPFSCNFLHSNFLLLRRFSCNFMKNFKHILKPLPFSKISSTSKVINFSTVSFQIHKNYFFFRMPKIWICPNKSVHQAAPKGINTESYTVGTPSFWQCNQELIRIRCTLLIYFTTGLKSVCVWSKYRQILNWNLFWILWKSETTLK